MEESPDKIYGKKPNKLGTEGECYRGTVLAAEQQIKQRHGRRPWNDA